MNQTSYTSSVHRTHRTKAKIRLKKTTCIHIKSLVSDQTTDREIGQLFKGILIQQLSTSSPCRIR